MKMNKDEQTWIQGQGTDDSHSHAGGFSFSFGSHNLLHAVFGGVRMMYHCQRPEAKGQTEVLLSQQFQVDSPDGYPDRSVTSGMFSPFSCFTESLLNHCAKSYFYCRTLCCISVVQGTVVCFRHAFKISLDNNSVSCPFAHPATRVDGIPCRV